MTKSPSGCRFEPCTFTRTAAGGSPSRRPSMRDPGGDGTVERRTIASAAIERDASLAALRPAHVGRRHRRALSPSRPLADGDARVAVGVALRDVRALVVVLLALAHPELRPSRGRP